MKKFLLGSVALAALGIGASANAADMVVRRVAPAPAFSWTGCYLGAQAGYEWGRDDGYNSNGSTALILGAPGAAPLGVAAVAPGQITSGFSTGGLLGGGYGGCNYQFGAIVVGVEGDWQAVNKEGQGQFVPYGPPTAAGLTPGIPFVAPVLGIAGFANNNWLSAKERWIATARGRVGYAIDKWLFFASGGAAWAQIDTEFFCLANGFPGPFPGNCAAEQHDHRTGWTVGAGVEYAPAVLRSHWTVKAEYLYVRIPSYNTLTSPNLVTGTAENLIPLNVSTGRMDNHIVRFGIAYKFGPWSGSELR
jgi:outer membrane immunogenic protein